MHVIIFVILTVNFIFSRCSLTNNGDVFSCVKQNDRNDSFGLIWSDEFEGELDQDKWTVSSENKSYCDDIFKCYHSRNVLTHDGLLILKASYENSNARFTGAKLTSKQYFGHGRYEMRLIQPKANLKSCIYTWDPNNVEWRVSGRIVLTCTTEPKLYYYRSVHFGKNNDSRDFEAQLPGVAQVSENWFNLYGFEWTHNQIRFFFDDTYGKPISLNGTNFFKSFQIRFLIRLFNQSPLIGPIANTLDELEWECPAFLIDYVRVYEKIGNSNKNNLQGCSHSNKMYTKSHIDQICQRIFHNQLIFASMKTEDHMENASRDPKMMTYFIVIFIGLFGVFICFIFYLYCQIDTIKKEKQVASPVPDSDYEYISDYYELQPINDTHLETRPSSLTSRAHSYVSLQDANLNEYIPMKTPVTTDNSMDPSSKLTLENKTKFQ